MFHLKYLFKYEALLFFAFDFVAIEFEILPLQPEICV